jgi:ParB family transcriptional regulator, chromosome partitioning protein
MEHTKELLSINLSNLVRSPHNVRRHTTGDVETLAALIASQGLLHPLIVTEHMVGETNGKGARKGKSRTLKFAVAAGERRRCALLLLQRQGRLAKAHAVLCELVAPERALEVSVAENSGREALHPADEFDAFKAMTSEGKGIEDVAARFGVSPLTVQRRLKLAALSPKLLALYRQDGINLDQLMALALSDDHAAQERAWFDTPAWDRAPALLRRKLTAGQVEAAGSALARFVGIEDYEAAGGVVRRDLFDDQQSRFLADVALLDRLAAEKLEACAANLRCEGWSWVEARMTLDSHALRQFAPCGFALRKPVPAEQAALADMTKRLAEIERETELLSSANDWTTDDWERIDLEQQDIDARRKAINEALKIWAPEDHAHAGVIVTIGRDGDVEVIRGLMREADRKAAATAQKAAAAAPQVRPADAPSGSASGADAQSSELGLSDSLSRRLAAHRTVALQAMVVRNTSVALAALAHVLVQRAFGDEHRRAGTALQIAPQLSAHALKAVADDLVRGAAWQAVEAAKLAWAQRLPEERGTWFDWLIGLPQAELLDLLALCTALTLNALPGTGAASDANALAAAVGLDMAEWWEPTAAGYLNHVSKAQIVQALKEAGPELAADGVNAMKKDALVVTAAARLAGKRWLPAVLRRPTC